MRKLRPVCPKYYVLFAIIFSTGFGTLSACQMPDMSFDNMAFETTVKRPNEPPIAMISGTYIYASDVARHAQAQNMISEGESLPRTDPRFETALQELIDQRLLALGALGQDLHTRGGIQRRVSLARERILSSAALEVHLADSITEVSLKAAYDRQVELGRNTGTFEQSRAHIKALLTAEQIEKYLTSLRAGNEIKILKPQNQKLKQGSEDE